MKEQFDKRLVDKIKDSFSSHEEPYDPAQWEKLKKAYFRPKKNGWAAFWPFISAGIAASLILILVYFPYEDTVDRQVKIITDSIKTEKAPLAGLGKDKPGEINKEQNVFSDPGIVVGGAEENLGEASGESQVYSEQQVGDKPERNLGSALQLGHSEERKIEEINSNFFKNLNELQVLLGEKNREQINSPLNDIKNEKQDLSDEEAQKLIDEWKSSNPDPSIAEVPKMAQILPFRVGLMVSPQSSSNPISGMNLGAGIVTEFSISKKLKLDVGLAYANQSLSPQNLQEMPRSMASLDAGFSSRSSIIGTDYELNFASLDIPVNLKYKVWDQTNSGVYLITGLSTMVYLDQNTVETFQTNSLFIADNRNEQLLYSQSVQEFKSVVTPESGENNLDFAGLLNLSVGYEYQLNKDFNISLEPFYKFPLGGLTFADQKFSIGGVNFRMNFNFKK